jgi:large subunit ribosomal protein L4
MQYDVLNSKGEKVRSIELNDAIFNAKVNEDLIYRAVVAEQANRRPGTAFFKNRALVKMTTKKMYKQKGTGNARHGAASANIFVGGGAAFGAQRHNYKKNLPRKMKAAALRSLLSLKVQKGQLRILDRFDVPTGKTREMVSSLGSVRQAGRNCLLVLDRKDAALLVRAARNIGKLEFTDYRQLSADALYGSAEVVLDSSTAEKINAMKWE